DRGIENTQAQRRISLRMGRVRKISNRFQAHHGGYLIAARLASASVHKTPHFICQKVRRFLAHKRNEAQRVLCRLLGETAGEREPPSEHLCHDVSRPPPRGTQVSQRSRW